MMRKLIVAITGASGAIYGIGTLQIDDIVDQTVGRALDLLGIDAKIVKRWGEEP